MQIACVQNIVFAMFAFGLTLEHVLLKSFLNYSMKFQSRSYVVSWQFQNMSQDQAAGNVAFRPEVWGFKPSYNWGPQLLGKC